VAALELHRAGLLPHERRLVAPAIVSSLFLFYAGTAFSYFVVLPFTIQFLLGFQTQLLNPCSPPTCTSRS
jgi:sec-independent protein translocase protein TatC